MKSTDTKVALKGMLNRAEAAVQLDNLEDKIIASNHIKVEQNLLLQKFQIAIKKKYEDTQEQMYGFKDEANVMKSMSKSVRTVMDRYRPDAVQQPKRMTNPGNPLASLFNSVNTAKMNDNQPVLDRDKDLAEAMKEKRLDAENQLKLIMNVKEEFDNVLTKRRIFARMATHLKNFVIEKEEIENVL